MPSTEYLTRQLFLFLSDISHPIEGTFYLILIALIVRWRFPIIWNNFLKRISAPIETNMNQKDLNPDIESQAILNDASELNNSLDD